jgi:hypothetical protein
MKTLKEKFDDLQESFNDLNILFGKLYEETETEIQELINKNLELENQINKK